MLNPNPDILYYTAIGDAYCLATEYIKPNDPIKEKALKFQQYLAHPSWGNVPGTYSDDTQQSIANAEVLLENSWSEIDFANAWVGVFKRDYRNSYARGFQKFLEEIKSGEEFLDKIVPVSNKNGAAMRSAVFGVLPDTQAVLDVSTRQAKITHNTFGGLLSAQGVALMSHYCLHTDLPLTRICLGSYLRGHLIDYWRNSPIIKSSLFEKLSKLFLKPWAGRIAGDEIGLITLFTSIDLLVSCKSLLEILQKTIELGGDTDSVAAISLGIGSSRLPDDLLAFIHNNLEIGSNYGTSFLKRLGSDLMRKFC